MAIICKLEPTLMNYIEHVNKCNRHNLLAFRPFILENIKLGNIRHDFVNKLLAFNDIFKEIFKDYLNESGIIRGLHADNKCPDKLEPREGYLPKEGLRIIRKRLGLKDDEPL